MLLYLSLYSIPMQKTLNNSLLELQIQKEIEKRYLINERLEREALTEKYVTEEDQGFILA